MSTFSHCQISGTLADMSHLEILTAREAAQLLGVHVATIARLAERGDLVALKKLPGPRGARMFHRDEVTRVLVERQLAPKRPRTSAVNEIEEIA